MRGGELPDKIIWVQNPPKNYLGQTYIYKVNKVRAVGAALGYVIEMLNGPIGRIYLDSKL